MPLLDRFERNECAGIWCKSYFDCLNSNEHIRTHEYVIRNASTSRRSDEREPTEKLYETYGIISYLLTCVFVWLVGGCFVVFLKWVEYTSNLWFCLPSFFLPSWLWCTAYLRYVSDAARTTRQQSFISNACNLGEMWNNNKIYGEMSSTVYIFTRKQWTQQYFMHFHNVLYVGLLNFADNSVADLVNASCFMVARVHWNWQ